MSYDCVLQFYLIWQLFFFYIICLFFDYLIICKTHCLQLWTSDKNSIRKKSPAARKLKQRKFFSSNFFFFFCIFTFFSRFCFSVEAQKYELWKSKKDSNIKIINIEKKTKRKQNIQMAKNGLEVFQSNYVHLPQVNHFWWLVTKLLFSKKKFKYSKFTSYYLFVSFLFYFYLTLYILMLFYLTLSILMFSNWRYPFWCFLFDILLLHIIQFYSTNFDVIQFHIRYSIWHYPCWCCSILHYSIWHYPFWSYSIWRYPF